MSKKHPQISVVVATYNRPSMLARCLKGLAEQGYEDFEVIIINDGGRNISKKIMKVV